MQKKLYIDRITLLILSAVRKAAVGLHRMSRGKLYPNDITITLLILHLPVAYLIAVNHLVWAGTLLVLLAVFDSLDGELARVQKRVTDVGGLLDAVSDRIKELLVYAGLIYYFAVSGQPPLVMLVTVIACGASLITPFVKAKGEAIIATYGHELAYDRLSRMFQDGLVPYAVRVVLLSIGLIAGKEIIPWVVTGLAIIGILMIIERLRSITRGIRK